MKKFQEIAQLYRSRIINGVYQPLDKIPSELEIGKEFAVSRTTVRKAIEELIREELIFSSRGSGTYVAPPKFQAKNSNLYSFARSDTFTGMSVESEIIDFQRNLSGYEEIRQMLELEKNQSLAYIERLRMVNDEPYLIEKTFTQGINITSIDSSKFETNSFYDLLSRKIVPNFATEEVLAGAVPNQEAKHLQINANSPALIIKRKGYHEGKMVEFTTSYARPDRYHYTFSLRTNP